MLWSTSFTDESWAEDAGVVVRSRDDTRVVAQGPDGRDGVLEITFGRGGSRWGFDFRHDVTALGLRPLEDVWFAYDVYLAPDFEFRGDGKLGGLAGITAGVDPLDTSAGGTYDPRSFSVRAMWREDRSLVMYLYARHGNGRDIDDPANYGFGIVAPFVAADGRVAGVLEPGRWHRIEHHVRMNTPGQADGVYEMVLDGHLGISLSDVEYRTAEHPDLRVNELFSSWFFGGDESQFPTRVNVAWTDDWVLATQPGARPPA